MSLRALLALFILLIQPTNNLFAGDKQAEGMALIQKAVDLTDLRKSGPYRMRANVTMEDETFGRREGIDVHNFISPERWRRDLDVTGYNEIAVFLGGYMYRSRNTRFTPPGVRGDLSGTLRNLPETLNYKVLRVYDRKVNGVDARCVYLQQNRKEMPAEIKWCFDASTGLPIVTLSSQETWYTEFSSYKAFGNKFIPGKIELFEKGKSRGAAIIEFEPSVSNEESIFKIPSDAMGRRWCDDMQGPRSKVIGPVSVPPGARSHQGLELFYELTIDEHGKVLGVVPMAEKPFVDRIAIETMRNWEFEPARCGDTPVPTDIVIDLKRFMRQ
jgi:hypothetical protein